MCAIIERSAGLLNVPVEPTGALQIALRSRGTPRVANSLLRWVRDYAHVRGDGVITEQLAHDALTMICLLYTSKWRSSEGFRKTFPVLI